MSVTTVAIQPVVVISSNIAHVGYDEESKTLEVAFIRKSTGGVSVYRYEGVPEATFKAFLAAESKGVFFRENIRDQYPTHKMPDAA